MQFSFVDNEVGPESKIDASTMALHLELRAILLCISIIC